MGAEEEEKPEAEEEEKPVAEEEEKPEAEEEEKKAKKEEKKAKKSEAKGEKKPAKIETEFLQLSLLGDKNIDKVFKLMGAYLNKFQQDFQNKLNNGDPTEKQVKAILKKGEDDLENITDKAKVIFKSFGGIFKKANNSTKEHMKTVFQRFTKRIQGAEKMVGRFNRRFKIEKKEKKAEAKKSEAKNLKSED